MTVAENINKAGIGNAFILIVMAVVGLISICALIGVFLVFRTIKSNRSVISNEHRSTPNSIHFLEAKDIVSPPCRQMSGVILEEGIGENSKVLNWNSV